MADRPPHCIDAIIINVITKMFFMKTPVKTPSAVIKRYAVIKRPPKRMAGCNKTLRCNKTPIEYLRL